MKNSARKFGTVLLTFLFWSGTALKAGIMSSLASRYALVQPASEAALGVETAVAYGTGFIQGVVPLAASGLLLVTSAAAPPAGPPSSSKETVAAPATVGVTTSVSLLPSLAAAKPMAKISTGHVHGSYLRLSEWLRPADNERPVRESVFTTYISEGCGELLIALQ